MTQQPKEFLGARKNCPYWRRDEIDIGGYKHCQNPAIRSRPSPAPEPVICEVCHKTHNCCQNAARKAREDERKQFDRLLHDLAWRLCGSQKTNIYCETVDAEIQMLRKYLRAAKPPEQP